MRTGVPQPFISALTRLMTKKMQLELDDLENKWESGMLDVSGSRFARLRIGIMNKYSITRKMMIARVIEDQVRKGNTTWKEQTELFDKWGKAISRRD